MCMAFTEQEKKELLDISGVGETFIARLEEMGFGSIELLRSASVEEIVSRGAEITGSVCYKNSPQAKRAAESVIVWAEGKGSIESEDCWV